MTDLEKANDERVFRLFKNLLTRARDAAVKAQAAEAAVFRALDDMCIDPGEVPTDAENADNLGDAVTCFLSYGEYSVAGIMREVKRAYTERGED